MDPVTRKYIRQCVAEYLRDEIRDFRAEQPDASTIGARGSWTCARCGAKATSHQVLLTGQPLEAPAGWEVRGAATYCDACPGETAA